MFIFSRIKELEERVKFLEDMIAKQIINKCMFDITIEEEEEKEVVVKKKRGRPRKK